MNEYEVRVRKECRWCHGTGLFGVLFRESRKVDAVDVPCATCKGSGHIEAWMPLTAVLADLRELIEMSARTPTYPSYREVFPKEAIR